MTDPDASMGPDGLTRRDRDLICDVLARYPEVHSVTLFGSRAMGTFGRGSDIDLALEGPDLDTRTLTRIATELEDSDLPYKVDLLLRDEHLEPKLEAHIRRHGKPFGWEQATLGEFVTLQRGYDLTDGERQPGNVPVVGAAGQNGFHNTAIAKGPGIVVGRSGASFGQVHFCETDFWPHNTGFYVTDFRGNLPRFVFYYLKALDFSRYNSGSAQPSLNRNYIYTIDVQIPPPAEQRAIAGVLSALDDKIEQNRRTAWALERLARAIFRAWFVDFEPVKAKAAGATAFPSMPQPVFDALPTRFVDSDIGPVPEGWEPGELRDLATISKAQVKPLESSKEMFDHFSIPAFDAGTRPVIEAGSAIKSNKFLVAEGSVLLSKLNPRISRVWLPPTPRDRKQIASTEFLVLVPSDAADRHYLYCLFRQAAFQDDLAQGAIGTSNRHQRVRPNEVLNRSVVVPPKPIRAAFSVIADSLFALVTANHDESAKLAEMRDYLLPNLLSGHVRVVAAHGEEGPPT